MAKPDIIYFEFTQSSDYLIAVSGDSDNHVDLSWVQVRQPHLI